MRDLVEVTARSDDSGDALAGFSRPLKREPTWRVINALLILLLLLRVVAELSIMVTIARVWAM